VLAGATVIGGGDACGGAVRAPAGDGRRRRGGRNPIIIQPNPVGAGAGRSSVFDGGNCDVPATGTADVSRRAGGGQHPRRSVSVCCRNMIGRTGPDPGERPRPASYSGLGDLHDGQAGQRGPFTGALTVQFGGAGSTGRQPETAAAKDRRPALHSPHPAGLAVGHRARGGGRAGAWFLSRRPSASARKSRDLSPATVGARGGAREFEACGGRTGCDRPSARSAVRREIRGAVAGREHGVGDLPVLLADGPLHSRRTARDRAPRIARSRVEEHCRVTVVAPGHVLPPSAGRAATPRPHVPRGPPSGGRICSARRGARPPHWRWRPLIRLGTPRRGNQAGETDGRPSPRAASREFVDDIEHFPSDA